ncbi:hypothetical protein BDW59DRAFT_132284 [Aspergillus cavernicola]|uniref:Uncharacterized protein n=1 Tax=Aspergillus cavernicola TaxID=176166 RepID=A0ABR4HPT0_9EURO
MRSIDGLRPPSFPVFWTWQLLSGLVSEPCHRLPNPSPLLLFKLGLCFCVSLFVLSCTSVTLCPNFYPSTVHTVHDLINPDFLTPRLPCFCRQPNPVA